MLHWCKECIAVGKQMIQVWRETPGWVKVLVVLVLADPMIMAVALACGAHLTTIH